MKIHAPQRVLDRNADILDLQPPVKEFLVTAYSSTNKAVSIWVLIKHSVENMENYSHTILKKIS